MKPFDQEATKRPLEGTSSEVYERYIVQAWMGEWAEVRPGSRVFDVDCGTGLVARKSACLAGSSGKVTGLDADKKMLRPARQFAELEGMPTMK